MNFARNAAGLLLTSAVNVPITFLTSVILARFLSVEDRGIYSLVSTLAMVMVMLGQMGWPPASIYRLRRAGALPGQVASTGALALLLISGVIVVACIVLRPLFQERLLSDPPALVFYLAVATIPLQLLSLLIGSIARGTDRFAIQNWFRFFAAAGNLVMLTGVLAVRDGTLVEAMTAMLAVQATCVAGAAIGLLRHTGFSFRFDWEETRESLRFGVKSYLQALAGQVHERIDLFMIAYFLRDPEQVAYYTIAIGLVQRLMILPDSVGSAAYPQLAGLGVGSGAAFVSRVTRQSILAVAGSALLLALVAPWFVPWVYGEPYRESIEPMVILLPGLALFTIYKTLSRYFTAQNRQQANIVTQAFSVVVNLLLNLWWIPRFGITGAALASLASYTLEAVLISIVFVRFTGVGPRAFLVVRGEDVNALRERLQNASRRFRSR